MVSELDRYLAFGIIFIMHLNYNVTKLQVIDLQKQPISSVDLRMVRIAQSLVFYVVFCSGDRLSEAAEFIRGSSHGSYCSISCFLCSILFR